MKLRGIKYISSEGTPVTKLSQAARKTDGRYNYYRFEIRFRVNGKQKRRFQWFRNEDDAVKYRSEKESNTISALTWSDAADLFTKSNTNTSDYNKRVTATCKAIEKYGCKYVDSTSLPELGTWLRQEAAKNSGRTANKKRAHLLSVAHWLRSQGLLKKIPFEFVPSMPHRKQERTPFRIEEVPDYLIAVDECARLVLLMLIFTGERLSAICNLQKNSVKSDRFTVIKKGGEEREILLTPQMADIIRQAESLAKKRKIKTHAVFFNTKGTPWTASNFDNYVKKKWTEAGLTPKVPHELRHLVGDTAGELNFSRDMIQAVLGHKQSATADHYVHPEAKRAKKVHEAVSVTFLSHLSCFLSNTEQHEATKNNVLKIEVHCPSCGHKHMLDIADKT